MRYFLFLILVSYIFGGCKKNCDSSLSWVDNGLKSVSLKPKIIAYRNKTYCGYGLNIKQWSAMPLTARMDDAYLLGDIFVVDDTIFLQSQNGIISPFCFWTEKVPSLYHVQCVITSRLMDDNYKAHQPLSLNYEMMRDTIFMLNTKDTIQKVRIKNFKQGSLHDNLVIVIHKAKGIEGIYMTSDRASIKADEIIFAYEGNIYFDKIIHARFFDSKRMSIE